MTREAWHGGDRGVGLASNRAGEPRREHSLSLSLSFFLQPWNHLQEQNPLLLKRKLNEALPQFLDHFLDIVSQSRAIQALSLL